MNIFLRLNRSKNSTSGRQKEQTRGISLKVGAKFKDDLIKL